MNDRVVVRVRIEGRVQGVWYRGWTVVEAARRGLDGWVRNRADGSVEAVFAGTKEAVDEMLAACHRGPTSAWVERLTAESSADIPPTGFIQQPTL